MQFRRRRVLALLTLLVALGAATLPSGALKAQDSSVTLTVVVLDFNREAFASNLISDFEAAHPGIKVKLVTAATDIQPPASGLDKYLEQVQKYVSAADVVYVDRIVVSPEATRAGYFLDLAPLAQADNTLNPDDFYPAAWQSFAWDKGLWALPTSAQTLLLSYNAAAFDKAGLAYPNEGWTLDDLTNAIRKLAQKDADGKVTVHGIDLFAGYSDLALFRSLLGEGLYDDSIIPNVPKLDKPAVETLLDTWSKLSEDGLIGNDFNKAPISISPVFTFSAVSTQGDTNQKGESVNSQDDANQKREFVLLPGGKAGLDVQGYAVSAGTQYPDQAYALAAFLTTRAEAAFFGGMPARRSVQTPQGGVVQIGPNMSPEVKALNEKALDNGIPLSEMRYMDYLNQALQKMSADKVDAHSALQAVEAQAVTDQQTAADKKGKTVLAVATPIPSNMQPGKMALKFAVTSFMQPFPNREGWERLIQDFTQTDPQIGEIDLDTGFYDVSTAAEKADCFYMPYNAVPSANLQSLLNLDPFLTADASFDKADVVGNTLAQLQRDNKTWGLPIAISPSVLKYDSVQFSKAGVPAPDKGWTVAAFTDALKALKTDSKDDPPFNASSPGGTHLLMLMAAYGGLPLDYRTNPPTINFTDPATVDAIRQVLDLAKQGYIKYSALGNVGNAFVIATSGPTAAIYTDALEGVRITRIIGNAEEADPYRSVNYPKGSRFTPISYSIGTAYISAKSQNPEGCYRWISALAKHPELFSAMPVLRSLINDPATTATRTPDVTALYNQIDALLDEPTTVSFPSLFDGGNSQAGFLLQHWLYEAFDTYVLHDGDLNAALKDAETYAQAFQDCTAGLAPYDPAAQSQQDYGKQFLNCAAKADSRLKSFVSSANN